MKVTHAEHHDVSPIAKMLIAAIEAADQRGEIGSACLVLSGARRRPTVLVCPPDPITIMGFSAALDVELPELANAAMK